MLGHVIIHNEKYLNTRDVLPLNLTITEAEKKKIFKTLSSMPEIEAASPRIRCSGLISNYNDSTPIRILGIDPENELNVSPGITVRVSGRDVKKAGLLSRGGVLIPTLLARIMKLKIGDMIVIVTTNREGSVNALNLKIEGIIDGEFSAYGRDVYLHIEDVYSLLRTTDITEISVRVKNFDRLAQINEKIKSVIDLRKFSVSLWSDLSPVSSVMAVIDIMFLSSIMNVMMMAVYERTRDIGTLAAIGTRPGIIKLMFYSEAFILSLLSSIAGSIIGIGLLAFIRILKLKVVMVRAVVFIEPQIFTSQIFVVFIIVILSALLSTVIPARKAARLEPVDALRFI
jgi:putative ABC transport system permease protein